MELINGDIRQRPQPRSRAGFLRRTESTRMLADRRQKQRQIQHAMMRLSQLSQELKAYRAKLSPSVQKEFDGEFAYGTWYFLFIPLL
jgi:hypothetical protein